jgi:hypothetical protein
MSGVSMYVCVCVEGVRGIHLLLVGHELVSAGVLEGHRQGTNLVVVGATLGDGGGGGVKSLVSRCLSADG